MSEEVVVIYTARSTAKHRETVLDAFRDIAEATHAEPGCLGWAIHQGLEDPNLIVEVSRWTSAEASAEHGATPHVRSILELLNAPGVLEAPGELLITRALGFGRPDKGFVGSRP